MSPPSGPTLRLVGPLIQVACVGLLMRVGGQGRTVAEIAVERWLYGGFGAGLVLVLLGLTVFRTRRDPAGRGE